MAEIDQAAIEAVQDQLEVIANETEKVELELGMFVVFFYSHCHQPRGLQTKQADQLKQSVIRILKV